MKCFVWHLLPHKTKCNTLYTVTQNKKKITVVVLHIGLEWNLGHIIVQDLCFHSVIIINVFIHLDDFGENMTWTIRELLTQVDEHQVNFLDSLKIRVLIKTPFLTHPLPFCFHRNHYTDYCGCDAISKIKICLCICMFLHLYYSPFVIYSFGCLPNWMCVAQHEST